MAQRGNTTTNRTVSQGSGNQNGASDQAIAGGRDVTISNVGMDPQAFATMQAIYTASAKSLGEAANASIGLAQQVALQSLTTTGAAVAGQQTAGIAPVVDSFNASQTKMMQYAIGSLGILAIIWLFKSNKSK